MYPRFKHQQDNHIHDELIIAELVEHHTHEINEHSLHGYAVRRVLLAGCEKVVDQLN